MTVAIIMTVTIDGGVICNCVSNPRILVEHVNQEEVRPFYSLCC